MKKVENGFMARLLEVGYFNTVGSKEGMHFPFFFLFSRLFLSNPCIIWWLPATFFHLAMKELNRTSVGVVERDWAKEMMVPTMSAFIIVGFLMHILISWITVLYVSGLTLQESLGDDNARGSSGPHLRYLAGSRRHPPVC